MQIYNTLAHKRQELASLKKGHIGMYSCGPTVYNYAHIGNMRPYIITDLLKRLLSRDGYSVTHVMNITDVGHLVSDANLGEDKIRLKAKQEHKSAHEVAEFYTKEFVKDLELLNILMPNVMPRATEHVKDMLALVSSLDKKGYIYKVRTGMYYDTSMFKDYGQLMGMTFKRLNDYLIAGARVERAAGIRNTTDFAVWRFAPEGEREMVWESEYGKGFPGWHIECSAMSMRYLGEHFDIHTGGIDHLPIHHTNEIAQSEAATGKRFVDYWLHVEFLQVNGRKMSKSLNNVYTLQDLIDKGYSPMDFRYFILSGYYRSQLNFTFDALDGARNTMRAIYSCMERLHAMGKAGAASPELAGRIRESKERFFASLEDDLNSPMALSALHEIISAANKALENGVSERDAAAIIEAIREMDGVLGLGIGSHTGSKSLPKGAMLLVEERERLRKERKFKEADSVRKKLKEDYGVEIEDTPSGPVWHA